MAVKISTKKLNQGGVTLIEMATAVLIIGATLVGLMQLAIFSLKAVNLSQQKELALIYAREGMEAVRSFRDNTEWSINGPGSLTAGNVYHPEIDTSTASTTWIMAAGTDSNKTFARRIVFSNVSRDPATYDIESTYSAANHDDDTKMAAITVTWGSHSVILNSYITNWR